MANSIQTGKHFPMVIFGNERDTKSLATSGCVSSFNNKRPKDSLASAQSMIKYKVADRSGKRNDHDESSVEYLW